MATKTPTKRKRKAIRTEHPHIVRIPGVRGGEPIIEDSGISVWIVAGLHRKGDTVEDMATMYPRLSYAKLHDALSYYYDHQTEIDKELAEQDYAHEHPAEFMAAHNFKPDERGFFRYHPPTKKLEVPGTKRIKTVKTKGTRRNGR